MNQHPISRASDGLLSALDAVRNVKALLLMLGTLVAASLIFGLGGYMGVAVHPLFGAIFVLVSLAALFYGFNAVGIMLMDQARGTASRPPIAALLQALATGHRLLLVLLLVGLMYLAGLVVMMVLLLICKIPGIGPLLYVVVFPVCVVVSGIAIFALYTVVYPLAAPAVWDGATTRQAVSRLAAIARGRLVQVLVSMALLFLLVAVLVGFITMVLASGTFITLGLSAPILGGLSGMSSLMTMFSGGGSSSAAGYAMAGAIGGGVVYAIGFSLPGLVYVRGCCQVYQANVNEVDAEHFARQMSSGIGAVVQRADDLRKQYAPPVQTPPVQTPPVDAPAAYVAPVAVAEAAPVMRCAACGAALIQGDKFCGVCGAAAPAA